MNKYRRRTTVTRTTRTLLKSKDCRLASLKSLIYNDLTVQCNKENWKDSFMDVNISRKRRR